MGGLPVDGSSSGDVMTLAAFEPWLSRWQLVPTGAATSTRSGRFLPVDHRGASAMLKVISEHEERDGAKILAWWAGEGAARVLELDDSAVLLEMAAGPGSLAAMVRAGGDQEATQILCRVAATLHAKDPASKPAGIVALEDWFKELWPVADNRGGLLRRAATTAERLLANQRDRVVLHGDLHHDNVLDFGDRGWLAIDPKGLYGERTFDYVNLLRNPEDQTELAVARLAGRVELIAKIATVDITSLLEWTLAFTALSAAWILNDREEPVLDMAIAEAAENLLRG